MDRRSVVCAMRGALCGMRYAVCDMRYAICDVRYAVICRSSSIGAVATPAR